MQEEMQNCRKYATKMIKYMRDNIPRKQQTYTRIETEAGGAARRICPNIIRDNRRCDGREGESFARRERTAKR